MMNYEINNPGGGDCGFYAFAIGLIRIIQNECTTEKTSPTFDKWVENGLVGVTLEQLLKVDLHSLRKAPGTYETNLLSHLQLALRNIVAESSKNDLNARIKYEKTIKDFFAEKRTDIEGSSIYSKFSELVTAYMVRSTLHADFSKFNELALSPEVRILAQETARSLKPLLETEKTFARQQVIENSHIKKEFIRDINSGHSCILRGVDSIKEQGRWATHTDLNVIAAALNVNLVVTDRNNGKLKYTSTVTLRHNNSHWTTTVDLSPQAAPHLREKATPAKPTSHKSTTNAAAPIEKLTSKEEQVLATTLSSQGDDEKRERYKALLKALIQNKGLFSKVTKEMQIDINQVNLDTNSIVPNEGEDDADFALRLQEAEFRRSGLK